MTNVFVGIDPGIGGAVAVIDHLTTLRIYNVPKIKTPTGKNDYDIPKMVEILRPYCVNTQKEPVVVVIEAVHAMPGQGVSSTFHFGRGKGLWEGICHALGCTVKMVTPQTWKKHWPELIVPRMSKDKKPKTANDKKEAAKEKRLAKARAKEKAREIASQLFPDHLKEFENVNSDGRAEAALIARYASVHFEV